MADEKAGTNLCPLAFVSVITESPKNWSFYILLIPLGLKVAATPLRLPPPPQLINVLYLYINEEIKHM